MVQQYEVLLNVYNSQVEFLMAEGKRKEYFDRFLLKINILLLPEWLFEQ